MSARSNVSNRLTANAGIFNVDPAIEAWTSVTVGLAKVGRTILVTGTPKWKAEHENDSNMHQWQWAITLN